MADRLHLQPKHRQVLEALLREHLPDVEVWAYGSRVSGRSHDGSDLDLLLRGPGLNEIPIDQLGDFEEAVRESSIPFMVEARDWSRLPERFHREIERNRMVLVEGQPTSTDSCWRETTLSQLGRIVTGKTPPSRYTEYFGGNIPFVTPTDFDGRRYIDSTKRYLTKAGANAVRGVGVPKDAVMVSCIGSDMGKTAMSSCGCATNQQINSIIIEGDDSPLFVYYNLRKRRDEIRALASGSAQPILNKTAFGQLTISLPSPSEQHAIAHILGTLDDKIELNRRMNETLEAMARALFKSWFVDFDPVRAKMQGRHTGLPRHIVDLFPDRILGEIPEGWERKPVSDFASIKGGKQLPKDEFIENGPVPVFGGAGLMGHTDRCNADGYVISVGRVGAYCGQFIAHRGQAWVNNNASLIVQNKGVPGEWLLLALRNLDIELIKKGAAQPFVSNSDLAAMEIVAPSDSALEAFWSLAEPLSLRSEQVAAEMKTLVDLRGTLLPKLISGDLRLKDVDPFLERAL